MRLHSEHTHTEMGNRKTTERARLLRGDLLCILRGGHGGVDLLAVLVEPDARWRLAVAAALARADTDDCEVVSNYNLSIGASCADRGSGLRTRRSSVP